MLRVVASEAFIGSVDELAAEAVEGFAVSVWRVPTIRGACIWSWPIRM